MRSRICKKKKSIAKIYLLANRGWSKPEWLLFQPEWIAMIVMVWDALEF